MMKLRFFLRLCNGFSRFVPSFAWIAAPLIQKLQKNRPAHLNRTFSVGDPILKRDKRKSDLPASTRPTTITGHTAGGY